MTFISIVSVNIEYGNRNRLKIKERSNIISQYNPDLIFIQECDKTAINLDESYESIYFPIISSEMIEIYLKKDSEWKQEYVTQFNSELSYTTRTCKVIYLKNKITNKIIKLGNVHLCGGRYDENDNIGKMLIGNLKLIRKRKIEVIETLIKNYNIDIIAGDFNSDIFCYLNNEIQIHHHEYLNKISPKKSYDIYKEWNIAPYKYLENNNYNLSNSEFKFTSIYKTQPDSIWFKNMSLINYKYLDLITDNLSDHNGIYSKFKIK